MTPVQASPFVDEASLYRKVTWRIIPFLFMCYIFAYIDRVNVGFAKLQMQQDLGITDAVYGTAAGIFFFGYFLFEVPCNLMLQKVGAKFWLGPIMIIWGAVSACTMLVKSATAFYTVRFLLGVVESGFFPGVILYLTFWFPSQRRTKMVAAFMTAIPLSGLIGSPISGWLLERMSSTGGLRGWQWLFLIEAIPSLIAGVLTMFLLSNGPESAYWLNESERAVILSNLRADEDRKRSATPGHHDLADAFRSGRVWILCLVYFGINMGSYGVSFWMPQIIKDSVTSNSLHIGLLSMIPWAIGAVSMVWVGHHSDQTGERRWHVGLVCILGAAGLAVSAVPGLPPVVVMLGLAMATAGIVAGTSTFWSLPTSYLTGAAATAGIAWINSVGNLGGYVGPWAIGKVKDFTQSITWAMLLLSAGLLLSAALAVLAFRPALQPPESPPT